MLLSPSGFPSRLVTPFTERRTSSDSWLGSRQNTDTWAHKKSRVSPALQELLSEPYVIVSHHTARHVNRSQI